MEICPFNDKEAQTHMITSFQDLLDPRPPWSTS